MTLPMTTTKMRIRIPWIATLLAPFLTACASPAESPNADTNYLEYACWIHGSVDPDLYTIPPIGACINSRINSPTDASCK